MSEQHWFETNRRMWNERVPIHVSGGFYDVDGFRRGGSVLRDFEVEDVGDVTGKDLVHLQCHFGLDSMSWERLGANVTGLDFSPPAVEFANRLACELGLASRFVEANVYDAVETLGATYDVVYTGLGALCWLPDLERWADVVAQLVRPGGMVYVAEFHPMSDVFGDDDLTVTHPYFQGPEPLVWNEPGTYADLDATTSQNHSFEWIQPVSRVIDVLLRRGLVLETFREHDFTLFPRWPFLELTGRDTYRLPAGMPSVPLMYSLRLRA